MKTTKQARRDAKRLFRLCVVDGQLDENRVRLLLRKIIESRRRGSFGILSRFRHIVKLHQDRHTARVESAVPLPANLQAGIEAWLARKYGRGITARFMQNPELIGGIRLQVGSDVYDGSVKAALQALAERF